MNLDLEGNQNNGLAESTSDSSSSKNSTPIYSDYFDEASYFWILIMEEQFSFNFCDLQVIGHIENLVMDEDFQNILNHFMESYYKQFDNKDENKIVYMEIFQLYTTAIEDFIVGQLNERMGFFDMERFVEELE